jgi:hypothetical protein
MVFKPKSFQPNKSCYFSSMDLKGLDLSWFPLKEPTSCLMSVVAHTSTIEIPQMQPQHHYMVSLTNWTKIKNRIGECDLIHFIISLCSQNPRSSHYPANIFFSKWSHCTFTLRPPNCQRWCCHINRS